MSNSMIWVLALCGASSVHSAAAESFAEAVVAYLPGVLPANLAGYTNAAAALGEPSRSTPGPYGGPVDPFSPPYLPVQLVSIGSNGVLTVEFATPILDHPANPFGLDFLVFGSAGFIITNGNYTGGGITDGSLWGNDAPRTRVSVSPDGVAFYRLDPARAPTVDHLFPTDGAGDFTRPVDPALKGPDLAGCSLAGLRDRYRGSAGGTGFDLAWAQDSTGQSVALPAVRFVRLEVLEGHAEIDGLARVSGGPGQTTLAENFRQDPLEDGWRIWGDSALFAWSPGLPRLAVTWDSSRSNSYFYRPLPAPVTKADSFSLVFGLELESVAVGVTTNKPFTFELAVGLCRWADATNNNFLRGTGQNSPNLVEFDYFPKSDYDATVSLTVISSQHQFRYSMKYPMELVPGNQYQVRLSYDATAQRLNTVLTQNGQPFGPITDVRLGPDFDDFRVDTLIIASYSDAQNDGSLLARGFVTDLVFAGPAAPVFALTAQPATSAWQLTFHSQSGWRYNLERTGDFQSWVSVGQAQNGVEGPLTLTDPDAPSHLAFYRVRGDRF